jgi:hypothetical protein
MLSSLSLPAGIAVAMLATPALALPDEIHPGSRAYLSTGAAVLGGTVPVELRSQMPGSPAVLAFGSAPIPVALGPAFPILHVGAPFALHSGVIAADGKMALQIPLPPGFPAGTEVFLQAAVVSPSLHVHSSQAIRLAPGGNPASFTIADPGVLPPQSALYGASDADWADLDKDGYADVVVTNEGAGALANLLMNQGGTGFVDEAAVRLPLAAQIPTAHVEAGDIDDDGDLDLFLAGGLGAVAPIGNLLLINDGTGHFAADPAFPAGAGLAIDAEMGDVDGDGDLDVLVANKQDPDHPTEAPDGLVLYRNVAGAFVEDTIFGGVVGTDPHFSGGSISLADLDDDADLDIFIARADTTGGGAQNVLLQNDGTGAFEDVTVSSLPQVSDDTFGAQVADLNGDGRLDVVLANSISTIATAVHILYNAGVDPLTGAPFFVDGSASFPTDLGPATKVRVGIDVADVDGDGDPDVVVAIHQLFDSMGMLDGDAVLLINQGGIQAGSPGTFAVDPNFDLGGSGFVCHDAAFGDADHDGDPDLFLASNGDLFGALPPQDVLVINNL